uniref:Uncharacterized protein n=1 Tax=Avena sativa TaxID=4498 RepID=A0ACD6A6Q1_AVESA
MSWPWESTAAVDGRFYAQHPTAFTVAKADNWKGPGFNIINDFAGGAAVLQVQTDHVGNGNLRSLAVLDAASHDTLLSVEEFRSGDGLKRWEAFRGRGTSTKDRLFVAMDKTRLFQIGNTVHVFLGGAADSSGERVPDLVVDGGYFRGTMTVSCGAADDADFVAQIRKEAAYYSARIKPGVDQALVLALTVILDQMHNPYFDAPSCKNACRHR